MSEFERWQEERRYAERAGAVHIPSPARPSVHADVLVPALQAAVVGLAIAIGATGLLLLFRVAWALAWRWGAGLGLGSGVLSVIAFVLQHRLAYIGPVKLAFDRADGAKAPRAVEREEEPWRVIRPALPATIEHQVRAIEPEADPEIRELYEFITRIWPTRDVSRENCRKLGYGRAQWERWIGGQRGRLGQESAKGLLARAGVVGKRRGGWEIVVPMGAALAWNDELRAYAKARRAMVRDRTDGTGRDAPGAGTGPVPGSGAGQ